jgi:deazaflavin-dependent oxidoreductase (nitroreductase family)
MPPRHLTSGPERARPPARPKTGPQDRRGSPAPATARYAQNTIMSALVRAGLVPRSYLLTTRGRKTGQPRTNPVMPVEHGGRRWLVAPYRPVSWVHNARAAGQVSLTRRRDTRHYTIREVPPDEAGPVLKRYVRLAPSTRRYFQATKDSPVENFVAEADRHRVFELIPVHEDRQRDHPGR